MTGEDIFQKKKISLKRSSASSIQENDEENNSQKEVVEEHKQFVQSGAKFNLRIQVNESSHQFLDLRFIEPNTALLAAEEHGTYGRNTS